MRIDPATNQVTTTIDLGAGSGPWDVTSDGRFLWVTDRGTRDLSKIDPATNQVVGKVGVGSGPTEIAFAKNKLWVTAQNGTLVTEVDPATGLATTGLTLLAGFSHGIAADSTSIWITGFDQAWVAQVSLP
jgi:YVTN family beta-propeller protein